MAPIRPPRVRNGAWMGLAGYGLQLAPLLLACYASQGGESVNDALEDRTDEFGRRITYVEGPHFYGYGRKMRRAAHRLLLQAKRRELRRLHRKLRQMRVDEGERAWDSSNDDF